MDETVSSERERLIRDDAFCRLVGIEVTAVGPGTATTALEVTTEHLNFHDIPHGGVIYTLADAAFAAASNAEGTDAFALETNISYLDRVAVGEELTAEATRTHDSRRTAEYQVEVTDPADTRIATFRGRVYKP